jgi:ribosomal protein S18 acetylase RimI-like enzyme
MDIVRLQLSQLDLASAVLARAFRDDPAWQWVIPDSRRRERLLPWLFRVGFDVTAADVWTTSGPVLGAARWLAPGRPPARLGPTMRALVATPVRLGRASGRFFAYGRAVETLRARVAPGPHGYLAGIGVDPAHQGRGIGAALLRPGIEGAARDRMQAVLLTNNPRALSFYERHGFRVVGEADTPPGGAHAWAMVRDP